MHPRHWVTRKRMYASVAMNALTLTSNRRGRRRDVPRRLHRPDRRGRAGQAASAVRDLARAQAVRDEHHAHTRRSAARAGEVNAGLAAGLLA